MEKKELEKIIRRPKTATSEQIIQLAQEAIENIDKHEELKAYHREYRKKEERKAYMREYMKKRYKKMKEQQKQSNNDK